MFNAMLKCYPEFQGRVEYGNFFFGVSQNVPVLENMR
jgi:hypothetical protein